MNKIAYIVIAIVVLILAGQVLRRLRPRRLNAQHLTTRWLTLQKHCASRQEWYQAVVDADQLLDDVLKRLRYRGKSTGERLVQAQHTLSNNESVWFGHKLRNRIVQEDYKKLSKQDTLEALSGFRQALKDLGALLDPRAEVEKDQ